LLSDGSLPARSEHETDTSITALDSIMGDVEHLSRGR
jgi:RNA polymerase sigma-70 factor (ECF subfamily)